MWRLIASSVFRQINLAGCALYESSSSFRLVLITGLESAEMMPTCKFSHCHSLLAMMMMAERRIISGGMVL